MRCGLFAGMGVVYRCFLCRMRVVRGRFLRSWCADVRALRRGMAGSATMLAVWRDVLSAVMPVAVVNVDWLGNVCRGAVSHWRHISRFCYVCRRTVVYWPFVCDASRAVDAKRRYWKKHFSRVVHVAPAFLFALSEETLLLISDRKDFSYIISKRHNDVSIAFLG